MHPCVTAAAFQLRIRSHCWQQCPPEQLPCRLHEAQGLCCNEAKREGTAALCIGYTCFCWTRVADLWLLIGASGCNVGQAAVLGCDFYPDTEVAVQVGMLMETNCTIKHRMLFCRQPADSMETSCTHKPSPVALQAASYSYY